MVTVRKVSVKGKERAEKLRGLFDSDAGKTQADLARYCGVTSAAVALWVKRGGFAYDNAVRIASYFSVDPKWLYGEDNPKSAVRMLAAPVDDRYAVIDVEVRADKEWVKRNQQPPIAVSRDFLGEQAVFSQHCRLVRALGDRMEPEIKPGDYVLINENEKVISSGLVYAIVVDGEFRFCRPVRIKDGLLLRSDNPNYKEEEFTNDEMEKIEIIGRVILSTRTY